MDIQLPDLLEKALAELIADATFRPAFPKYLLQFDAKEHDWRLRDKIRKMLNDERDKYRCIGRVYHGPGEDEFTHEDLSEVDWADKRWATSPEQWKEQNPDKGQFSEVVPHARCARRIFNWRKLSGSHGCLVSASTTHAGGTGAYMGPCQHDVR